MPKYRRPLSLESLCVEAITNRIEWFAAHQIQLDCPTSELTSQVFARLKKIPGLDKRHFQLLPFTKRLDLSISSVQHGEQYVKHVMEIIDVRRPDLIAVDLANVLNIPEIFWAKIVLNLTNLQVCNLRSTNCGDRELLLISHHCIHIRELNLSLCERVTNFGVTMLRQSSEGSQLQALDLMQTQVDVTGVRTVLERVPGLLHLSWRSTINALSLIPRDHRRANAAVFSLQELTSDGFYQPGSLARAVELCPRAVKVTINRPSIFSAEELRSLENLFLLRQLDVILGQNANSGLYLDFHEAFHGVLVHHGVTLTHLYLGKIRAVDLHLISTRCPSLRSLTLERNRSYISESIQSSFPNLEKFHLTVRDRENNDESDRCPSSLDLSAILSAPLKDVKIAGCRTLDDSTLSGISSEIEVLELESCSNISMQSLWTVIDRPCLSSLKIHRCRLISRRDIFELTSRIQLNQWDIDVDYYSDSD